VLRRTKASVSEKAIVAAVAAVAAKRICRQTIRRLQAAKETSSGDDSGLTCVWDEFCVQVQGDESLFWEIHIDLARIQIEHLLANTPKHGQDALWLQTDTGSDWLIDEPEDREPDPESQADTVNYLLSEYIFRAADRWSNKRIKAYLSLD
jgi:hypothetical protein